MAGVKSGDLKPDAFESPAKQAELHALLAAYEEFLSDHARGDMAVVYEEAMQHPDWCPIQPEDCWTELPDDAVDSTAAKTHRRDARRANAWPVLRTGARKSSRGASNQLEENDKRNVFRRSATNIRWRS